MKSPKAWLAFKVVAIVLVALLGFFLLFNQQIEDFSGAYLEVKSTAEIEASHQRRAQEQAETQASEQAEREKSFRKCGLAEDCRLILTRCRVLASNAESFEKAKEHFGRALPQVNCRNTPAPQESDYHAECSEEGFCVAVRNEGRDRDARHDESQLETGKSMSDPEISSSTEENPMAAEFVTTRVFDAPREKVFAAWTDPQHMSKSMGPINYKTLDVKPGGTNHYWMSGPDGSKMWGRLTYKEVTKPSKLVYEQSFSDEQGGITAHPMAPTWPKKMLTTITFEDQGPKTKLTLKWNPVEPSAEENATFQGALAGVEQGWKPMFDTLNDYVKAMK